MTDPERTPAAEPPPSPARGWAQVRQLLWQPPRPHGEQPSERSVGPLELFYDLAVVVLVAQTAHHLAAHLAWHAVGEFAAVFTLVWIAWVNGSLHHELHGREDARGRSTFLLQILLLVVMGAMIPEAGGVRGAGFALASAVLFAVLAGLWYTAARGDQPGYHGTSRMFVSGTLACALLLAMTALLPGAARVPAWGAIDVAYLAGFAWLIVVTGGARGATLTITDALIERFGLFTIIVLGETLTNAAAGLAEVPLEPLTLAVGLIAVVVGFGAWWTYFDFAGQREPRPAPTATLLWILGHLPLAAAIAAVGSAIDGLITHAHDARTPVTTGWVLCGGTAAVLVTSMLLAWTLEVWRTEQTMYRPLALSCGAVAAACLALGALRPAPLALGIGLVVMLSVPWVLAVRYRLAKADAAEAEESAV